jgi:hypothetical protein
MKVLGGGCLCGAVEYQVADALRYAGYCHCSECRRFSGSAFSAFGGVAADAVEVTRGESEIATYRKSEDSLMCFCSVCGSSLFSRKPESGVVHLRLGSLTDTPSLRPQAHIFVGSKAAWYEITDDMPRFEVAPGKGSGT